MPLVVRDGAIAIRERHLPLRRGRARDRATSRSSIRPGEKVGLVGPSGAGKSTLVNLLLRFYALERGRILIDGQDIAGVTQDSLRAAIGMVTQDTSLLHRSVRDNISYGRPEADEAGDRARPRARRAPTASSPASSIRAAARTTRRMSASAA